MAEQDSDEQEKPIEGKETAENDATVEEPEETDSDEPDTGLGDAEKVMKDSEPPKRLGKFKRFFTGYWRRKKWTLPLTLLLVVVLLGAVPWTRYKILGQFVSKSYSVEFADAKTDTPVSGAGLKLDGRLVATTNAKGAAKFQAKVGPHQLEIDKKYYKTYTKFIFVGLKAQKSAQQIQLVATGRQVPVKIVNKLTGKPVSNAAIKVLGTEAKTDASGTATIVLPTGSPTQTVVISAFGFNSLTAKVQVTSNAVSANTFALTPSGRVYFLSNLSGNIDVVSTGLDGSNRQTILAGTGKEDQQNTVLLASRDWKFLALLSKRDGGQNARLFLVNTSTGQTTTIDDSGAILALTGWVSHDFIYQADRANLQNWKPGQQMLESYNADTGKLTVLDQTAAQGTSNNNYVSQDLGYGYGNSSDTYLIGNSIVYIKEWGTGYQADSSSLKNKQDQILSISADGTGKQILKSASMPADGGYQQINSVAYSPAEIYFQVNNNSGSVYYIYSNNSITQSNAVTDGIFQQTQQNYPTYLESPSGNLTFWAEQRDGKNTLFVGDANGLNGKQIATLSDYTSYGWYTDNYLLVEKGGSELYIMPAGGGTAVKISDYYKPAQNFNGYGGGYGGR